MKYASLRRSPICRLRQIPHANPHLDKAFAIERHLHYLRPFVAFALELLLHASHMSQAVHAVGSASKIRACTEYDKTIQQTKADVRVQFSVLFHAVHLEHLTSGSGQRPPLN